MLIVLSIVLTNAGYSHATKVVTEISLLLFREVLLRLTQIFR